MKYSGVFFAMWLITFGGFFFVNIAMLRRWPVNSVEPGTGRFCALIIIVFSLGFSAVLKLYVPSIEKDDSALFNIVRNYLPFGIKIDAALQPWFPKFATLVADVSTGLITTFAAMVAGLYGAKGYVLQREPSAKEDSARPSRRKKNTKRR